MEFPRFRLRQPFDQCVSDNARSNDASFEQIHEFRVVSFAMASLAQAFQIIQASCDAFEGISGAGILLDDEPLAACGLGGG